MGNRGSTRRSVLSLALSHRGSERCTKDHQQACLPRRHERCHRGGELVYEVQEQILARVRGAASNSTGWRAPDAAAQQSSADFSHVSGQHRRTAHLAVHGGCRPHDHFPVGRDESGQVRGRRVVGLGAWLMAMSQVYLWRQAKLDGALLGSARQHGAHFRLGNTRRRKEVFMPWNGIEAVHYKRIQNTQKFTILGTDTSTVTFTSYSFYRPKRVAHLIAERAGLPLVQRINEGDALQPFILPQEVNGLSARSDACRGSFRVTAHREARSPGSRSFSYRSRLESARARLHPGR